MVARSVRTDECCRRTGRPENNALNINVGWWRRENSSQMWYTLQSILKYFLVWQIQQWTHILKLAIKSQNITNSGLLRQN